MKRILTAIAIVIAAASCAKHIVITDIAVNDELNETIPVTEAISNLNRELLALDLQTVKSPSGIYSNIFSIGRRELFTDTKSKILDLPDTLFYVVNFEDGGFAVVSGNTRLNHSVLCIAEDGNLCNNDFVEAADLLVKQEAPILNIDDDDIDIDIGEKYLYTLMLSSTILDYSDTLSIHSKVDTKSSSLQVGPLLKTKWTQDGPFCELTPNNCPAGCVVIAVAQIMAYNNKPSTSSFETLTRSWAVLRSVYPYYNHTDAGPSISREQVAKLAAELGNADNCDVEYTPTASSSNIRKAKRTLENYGYDVTKHSGCGQGDIDRIDSQLMAGRPVYMRGQGSKGGHAWVVDGYKDDMFHINWGWNGNADGYYNKGVFKTANLINYDPMDPNMNTLVGEDAYKFNNFIIIINI